MNAIIRCRLCLNDEEMDKLCEDEDRWAKAWGQVQYYLEYIERVKFE